MHRASQVEAYCGAAASSNPMVARLFVRTMRRKWAIAIIDPVIRYAPYGLRVLEAVVRAHQLIVLMPRPSENMRVCSENHFPVTVISNVWFTGGQLAAATRSSRR